MTCLLNRSCSPSMLLRLSSKELSMIQKFSAKAWHGEMFEVSCAFATESMAHFEFATDGGVGLEFGLTRLTFAASCSSVCVSAIRSRGFKPLTLYRPHRCLLLDPGLASCKGSV